MTQIAFYHLERARVEDALPKLLEKALLAGYRALIRVKDVSAMEDLDTKLWTYDPASFLPHGCAGQDYEEAQPVLITVEGEAKNKAKLLAVLDGNLPNDIGGFERCLYMFDGQNPDAVQLARAHWAALKSQGHDLTYWQQNANGGWQQKA